MQLPIVEGDSFLRNCIIEGRESDFPLFVYHEGKLYCRLDGYRITPIGKTI